MANFKLDHVQYEDIPTITRLDRDAFYRDEHPAIEAMFPNSHTEAGLQSKTAKWQDGHNKVSNEHHIKVTDTSTGRIILSGKWLAPTSSPEELAATLNPPTFAGPHWDSEDDREWAKHLMERYTQPKRDMFKEKDGQVFSVTHLAVEPEHQRKGAGKLFMLWGIEQADELGMECTVEASLRAEPFYARWGFEKKERIVLTPPERWSGKGTQEYIWMVRKPGSKRPGEGV